MRGNALEDISQVRFRVETIEFCTFDQGIQAGSTLTARVGSKEHHVFAAQGGSAQRSLGGQIIDLETTVIAIATERLPAVQWIAQRDGQRSFLRGSSQRVGQPGVQRFKYRAGPSLALDAPLFG